MSKSKLSEAEIKLAEQFRSPSGEQGIVVANSMSETNTEMTMQTVKALSLIDNDTVLELGHGNAKHVAQIFQIQNNLNYVGLDISPLMQQQATKVNADLVSQQKVYFELYNGTSLPFSDNSFSKIFTVNTIYFWENPESMIDELYRVLKPNGLCCITFTHKDFLEQLLFVRESFTLYDIDMIKEITKHSPFKLISTLDHSELIPNKDGILVERGYTIASLIKP